MNNEKIIKKIIDTAILKYQLKSRAVMNTYIINEIIKNNFDSETREKILNTIEFYINTMQEQKKRDYIEQLKKDAEDIHVFINGVEIFE